MLAPATRPKVASREQRRDLSYYKIISLNVVKKSAKTETNKLYFNRSFTFNIFARAFFEENPNAIYKASYVIQAIEEWAAEYEKRNSLEFEDGVIVPKVNIGAIRGGLPYRISQTPGVCSIYVDVRLNPTQSPLEVRKELESVIKKTGVEYTIENYLYHQGYIANNVDRLIESVKKAHERELGYPPKKVLTPYCSMWRDINVFNEYKIPAITYGPTAYVYKNIGRAGIRALKKQELLQVSKIYGLIALDICKGIHKK